MISDRDMRFTDNDLNKRIDALSVKIKKWKEWAKTNQVNVKTLVSGNNLSMFVDDLVIAEKFIEFAMINPVMVTNRILTRTYKKGVVYHKHPKHKFRLYFEFCRFTAEESKEFINFIENNAFVSSDSLRRRLESRKRSIFDMIIYSTHFVDYDDDKLLTVMSLLYPKSIRKVCSIEKG